jgi:hypothetical protein
MRKPGLLLAGQGQEANLQRSQQVHACLRLAGTRQEAMALLLHQLLTCTNPAAALQHQSAPPLVGCPCKPQTTAHRMAERKCNQFHVLSQQAPSPLCCPLPNPLKYAGLANHTQLMLHVVQATDDMLHCNCTVSSAVPAVLTAACPPSTQHLL